MRAYLLLAVSSVALMTIPALAQETQTDETTEPAQATEQTATDQATESATDATETQTVATAGTEPEAAAAGDPMQALTMAAQQLQDTADQFLGGGAMNTEGDATVGVTTTDAAGAATDDTAAQADAEQMQQQATEALDQFDQALQQVSQEGDQAVQDQVVALQQQSQQVRQQLQDDPANGGQALEELAQSAMQLQTASIPAEADAIVGRQVVTSDGEEGGEVQDVLITADGQVEALLIKRGGALGLGGEQVAILWDQIQLQGDQIVVNVTRDEMQNMSEYQTE